jgi:hypothetical protein
MNILNKIKTAWILHVLQVGVCGMLILQAQEVYRNITFSIYYYLLPDFVTPTWYALTCDKMKQQIIYSSLAVGCWICAISINVKKSKYKVVSQSHTRKTQAWFACYSIHRADIYILLFRYIIACMNNDKNGFSIKLREQWIRQMRFCNWLCRVDSVLGPYLQQVQSSLHTNI